MQSKEIVTFFYEMAQLSRVKREGWRIVGMETPESIADHSLRAAQIGWVLAKLEGYKDPNEVTAMLVFHDEAARQRLKTKSAKALLEELPNVPSSSWWHGLKKLD